MTRIVNFKQFKQVMMEKMSDSMLTSMFGIMQQKASAPFGAKRYEIKIVHLTNGSDHCKAVGNAFRDHLGKDKSHIVKLSTFDVSAAAKLSDDSLENVDVVLDTCCDLDGGQATSVLKQVRMLALSCSCCVKRY
jgi:hypothetical protein